MAERKTDDIDPVWHALPVKQLLRHFEVDPREGLGAIAVQKAQARHGPDGLPEPPSKHVTLDFSPWSAQTIALASRVAPHARLLLFNAYQVRFEEKLHCGLVLNVVCILAITAVATWVFA